MAVAFDATAGDAGSNVGTTGTTIAVTLTGSIRVGNCVIVFFANNDSANLRSLTSVTDNGSGGGNKYVQLGADVSNTTRAQLECWICFKATVTATVITGTLNAASTRIAMTVAQYTGVIEVGGYLSGTQGSATALTQSKVTQGANSMVVCGFANQGTGTHTAGASSALRASNTSTGTATTAIGIASMDSTNVTSVSGTSIAVNQTLGTGGISANFIFELSPNFTLIGDEETFDDAFINNSGIRLDAGYPPGIVGAFAETSVGDYAEGVLPAANVFVAPLYNTAAMSEFPAFDRNATQGLLSWSEVNIGDNPELPPPLNAFNNQILMGYKGYWISLRATAEQSDYSVEKITPPAAVIFNDWTTDAENQKLQFGYVFDGSPEPNLGDVPEFPPTINSWTDVQLMNYTGYRVDPSKTDLVADTAVEKITLPFNDWTLLAEHQKQQPDWFKDHLLDEGVEIIITTPAVSQLTAWDNDVENQYYNGINIGNLASDSGQASTHSIILPPAAYDGDQISQDRTWNFNKDSVFDEGVEKITVPSVIFNDWTTDAEQQRAQDLPFHTDSTYDESIDQTVQIFMFKDQVMMSWRGYWIPRNLMMQSDDGVEIIILPPFIDEIDDLVDE